MNRRHELGADSIRCYDALGHKVAVRCGDPSSQRVLDHLLAPFVAAAPAGPTENRLLELGPDPTGRWALERDGEVLTTGASRESALTMFLAELNHEAVDAFAGFAAHAGVVATDGVAIALPGESGAGKSTLTAACVLAGFDYVSDEALCIDGMQSRVVPYPKPLSLTPSSWDLLGRPDITSAGMTIEDSDDVAVAAADLGGRVADTDLRLGHVVELVRREGPARLVAQPRQHAITSLLSMSFNHYKQPRASFELVSRLAAQCSAWRLEYGDPRAAAQLLRAELA